LTGAWRPHTLLTAPTKGDNRMANVKVPEDPKLRDIVERIERQLYRDQDEKNLREAMSMLQKEWTELKDYFIHGWVVRPGK
jgi:hypothetical protein